MRNNMINIRQYVRTNGIPPNESRDLFNLKDNNIATVPRRKKPDT